MKKYDLISIGSGEAGMTAAEICSKAGWKVALVEKRPLGGTCALRGCNPKRVLTGLAELVERLGNMEGKGMSYGSQMDWHGAMHFKEKMMETIPQTTENKLRTLGIDYYSGTAHFTGPHEITVNEQLLQAEHILIGTGSMPTALEIPGKELALSSDGFLNLQTLPRKVVFIGGGYIAYELAHVVKHAGGDAVILEATEQTLRAFDKEVVDKLNQASRNTGIEIQTMAKVIALEKDKEKDQIVLTLAGPQKQQKIEAEVVVNTTGRIPDVQELDLQAGQVKVNNQGIEVNQYLQSTSNPAVYACGDVLPGSRQLTPVAEMESRVIACNLLHGNDCTPDYDVIPSGVFTQPVLAAVGLKPDDDKRALEGKMVLSIDASSRHETQRLGYQHAFYKIVVEQPSGRLLGAHLLGHDAYEVINLLALAIKQKLTITQLSEMVWSFPSLSYDVIFSLHQLWQKQQGELNPSTT